MTKEVVIISTVRTAIGTFQGSLKDVPATTLGSTVIKAAIEHASISVDIVDEVIMGDVLQAVKKVLTKANLTLDQLDLVEANEAFAAQAIAVGRELGLNHEQLNVNGGGQGVATIIQR